MGINRRDAIKNTTFSTTDQIYSIARNPCLVQASHEYLGAESSGARKCISGKHPPFTAEEWLDINIHLSIHDRRSSTRVCIPLELLLNLPLGSHVRVDERI